MEQTVAISHNLKLDVMRIDDEFFDVHVPVPKSFLGFMTRPMKCRHQARFVARHAHAAAAAACCRFDHHRIADFLRDFSRVLLRLHNSVASRRHRHTGFPRKRPSSVFVAHRLHCTRGGANEFNIAALANFSEMRVLREKSISRMNRIDVANLGCAHDPIDLQVTFGTRRRADAD